MFQAHAVNTQVSIPHKRLLKCDSGKLQAQAMLLGQLRLFGYRVLIFTQMTKLLYFLEASIYLHYFRYLHRDRETNMYDRQRLVQCANKDVRVFCMIFTTCAGCVDLNPTGADCAVFYVLTGTLRLTTRPRTVLISSYRPNPFISTTLCCITMVKTFSYVGPMRNQIWRRELLRKRTLRPNVLP